MLNPKIIYIQARLNKLSGLYLYIYAFICVYITIVIKEKRPSIWSWGWSGEGLENRAIRKTWKQEKLKLEVQNRKSCGNMNRLIKCTTLPVFASFQSSERMVLVWIVYLEIGL